MSLILNKSMENFVFLSESDGDEEPYEKLSAFVKSFYDHMKCSNQFPTKPLEPMKSSALSLKFRNEGNVAYSQKNDSLAIVLYTKSISVALPDSEELAIAFANRSAVLFRREDYVPCFMDIKRALSGKYPESMKPKLAIRKKRCIQKIEKQNERNTLWLKNHDSESLEDPSKFMILWQRNKKIYNIIDDNIEPENTAVPLPEVYPLNDFLPGISSKIKYAYTEKWGRHLIATQDIKPGEVLGVEKLFTTTVLQQCRFTNCSFCFMRCINLIPCTGCSMVMYCSDHCRLEANKSYHQIECEICPFFLNSEHWEDDCMVLKMLLIGTKQGKELVNLYKNENLKKSLFDKRMELPDNQRYEIDYQAVCNLNLPEPSKLFVKKSLGRFGCAHRSSVLLHYLKNSSFFDAANQEINVDEIETFVASLLLNHSLITRYNGLAIFEKIVMWPQVDQTNLIGLGLKGVFSLASHSCDANVDLISNRNSSFMLAIQPIPAGQIILTSYFGHYYDKPIEQRLFAMKCYGIMCKCHACEFKWPIMDELPTENPKYLSNDSELRKKLKEFDEEFFHLRCITSGVGFNERYRFMCEYCSLLYKTIVRPWKRTAEVQSKLNHMMTVKHGNFHFYEKQ